jgi:glycosyltransferase involved in cell wall biosynthesis
MSGPPYPVMPDGIVTHNLPDDSYWTYHHYTQDYVFKRHPLSHLHPLNFYEFISTRMTLSSLLTNFSMRAYFKVRELSRERRFDIVHDNQTLGYGVWAMHKTGFPTVATIHHPLKYDLQNGLRQARSSDVRTRLIKAGIPLQARTTYVRARLLLWMPWIMQEVVARRLDRVIVVSETSRRDVVEAFRLPEERVRSVYNGVDTETFRPQHGIERQPNRILYVGNSEDRNKGARFLVEALRLLKDEIDFRVTFVDNVPSQLKLVPRLVDEYGLRDRFDFTGRLSTADLVRKYCEATLLVSPSVHEGFGLPLAEAMSCGTPTLATELGAYREIVEHGVSGWLVPPSDPRALADGIRMMLNNPELRDRIAQGGRKRIVETFNWRRAAEETLAVYEEVLPSKQTYVVT